MPRKTYKKLSIFVAAPSDVATEKEKVRSVVDQLNRGLADKLGIILEVKEWSQVVPNMGRGQQVIFDQLPVEEWDIMLGILWLRYGTPSGGTNPEDSGTHEEFKIAYESWQKTGKPHIMFYQCTKSPDNLKKIDLEALGKINRFFMQFQTGGENQGLYSTYDTLSEFEGLVRNHLEKILLENNNEEQESNALISSNDDTETHGDNIPWISGILSDYYDQIDEYAKHPSTEYGVPTGFTDLDKLINGLQPSNFILVASRSGESKTNFLLSIARNAALTYKKHIAIFLSLGMTSQKMVQHLIAQETGILPERLSTGKLQEKEWPLLTHAIELFGDTFIFPDDTPSLTYQELRKKSRDLHLKFGLDLIIVDNLQFLRNDTKSSEHINGSSYVDFKILAHELNVPVLVGLQLTRPNSQRADKRPVLSDLLEFKSLEDVADVIIFIHRPDMYDRDTVKQNIAEIIVAKHNFGYVGQIDLIYRGIIGKFENASSRVLNKNANQDE
jgi:hypothetical protein